MSFLTQYGSELLAGTVIFSVAALLIFIFRKMFNADKEAGIIKISPRGKIVSLEVAVICIAVLQGINSAFAGNEAGDVEFMLTLTYHLVLTGASGILIYRMWQEVKEAVIATEVLWKFVSDYNKMTWKYGVGIIFDFFIQWLQAIGTPIGGIICMIINLWAMAKSLDQEYLLYFNSWFTTPVLSFFEIPGNGLTLGQALREMDIRLGRNTAITIVEIIFITLLGLATFGRELTGAAKDKNERVKVEWNHLAGYMLKHLFNSASGIKPNDILAVIESDPATKISNIIKLEDAYIKAADADKIVNNRTKSSEERIAAERLVNEGKAELKNHWDSIAAQYTARTGKVPIAVTI